MFFYDEIEKNSENNQCKTIQFYYFFETLNISTKPNEQKTIIYFNFIYKIKSFSSAANGTKKKRNEYAFNHTNSVV